MHPANITEKVLHKLNCSKSIDSTVECRVAIDYGSCSLDVAAMGVGRVPHKIVVWLVNFAI